MSKRALDWLWLSPRALAIVFLVFLAMFSLDVVMSEANANDIAIGLFMHNIPVLVLLGCLIVAWRKDIVGAVGFSTAGAIYVAGVVGSSDVP